MLYDLPSIFYFIKRKPCIFRNFFKCQNPVCQSISEFRPVSAIAFLHLSHLIFQHTPDFVTHGFLAGLAEMNLHNIRPRS